MTLRDTAVSVGGVLLQCAMGTERWTESETLCLNPRSALGCVTKAGERSKLKSYSSRFATFLEATAQERRDAAKTLGLYKEVESKDCMPPEEN